MWRPGVDGMDADEELEYDPTAYDCLHAWQLEWPCLSFDVVRDELGENRTHFPHALFAVAGTQADAPERNEVAVMRVTRLKKTRRDPKKKPARARDESASESESESESDDSESDADADAGARSRSGGPSLRVRKIAHHGAVNRVRVAPTRASGGAALAATWSESGIVQVWDLSPQLAELASAEAEDRETETRASSARRVAPAHAFSGHRDEGYAVDWSEAAEGRLVTGDNSGGIHVWDPASGGRWAVSKEARFDGGHAGSVEDLQWSPAERDVFASCGSDGAVCIWDARQRAKPAIKVDGVSDVDVNVMSWNRRANYMLATGADDGALRIWDLRNFQSSSDGREARETYVANFSFHRGPITSVEWARFDSAMLATSSADHTVCVWDLAVERDAEEEAAAMAAGDNALAPEDLPPQLMFVHQGMRDPKELHWHHQIPGMCLTTAADGFNAFKAYNVGNEVA